jgi:hypothetical protein
MFKMRIDMLILRWYSMMAVGIIAVVSHQDWLIFATMLVAVSAILGLRIGGVRKEEGGRVVEMEKKPPKERRKAG